MMDFNFYIQQQKGYLANIFLTMIETEDFGIFKMCYNLLTESKIQKDYPSTTYLKLIFNDESPYSKKGIKYRKLDRYNRTLTALEKKENGLQLNSSDKYFLRKYKTLKD